MNFLDEPSPILLYQQENRMVSPIHGLLTPLGRKFLGNIGRYGCRHMIGALLDLYI